MTTATAITRVVTDMKASLDSDLMDRRLHGDEAELTHVVALDPKGSKGLRRSRADHR